MPRALPFDNAIAWAHFRLRGGTRRAITFFLVVLGLTAGGLFLTVEMSLGSANDAFGMWRGGILAAELVLMLLIAPGQSGSAVRADITGRLIESHRLMPISGAEAILGYLTGPNLNVLAMFAAAAITGLFADASASLPISSFLIALALIFSFGAMLCVILTFAAFRHRVNAGAAILFCIPFFINKSAELQLLPAASVLFGPFIGKTVFVTSAVGGVAWPYAVSELFQAAVAGLFFVAAARVYPRDQAVGFLPSMGLGLLALFVAASLTGIANPAEFSHVYFRTNDPQVPLTISILVGLLLALLPVSAAARRRTARLAMFARQARSGSFLEAWTVIALATCILLLFCMAVPAAWTHPLNLLPFPLIFLAFLTACYFLLRIAYRRSNSGFLVSFFVLAWWVGPPLLISLLRAAEADDSGLPSPFYDGLVAASPAGAITLAIVRRTLHPSFYLGLLAQLVLAAIAGLLCNAVGARQARASAAPPRAVDAPQHRPATS